MKRSANRARAPVRRLLALTSLVSFAALAGALVAQHVYGMLPCPWCIFQRVLYLGIGVVALLGALPTSPVHARTAHAVSALAVLALAIGGVASAVFQHQVAAKDSSCAFTFADRFLSATGLEALVPWLFQVTATCMDAAKARLLGQPFEVWSGLLFMLIAVTALWLLAKLWK